MTLHSWKLLLKIRNNYLRIKSCLYRCNARSSYNLSIQTNLVSLPEIQRFLRRPARGLFTILNQLSLFILTGLLISLQHYYYYYYYHHHHRRRRHYCTWLCRTIFAILVNQMVQQPINQLANEQTNEPTSQPVNERKNQGNQSCNQPTNERNNAWTKERSKPINHATIQRTNQSAKQLPTSKQKVETCRLMFVGS